MKYLTPTKEQLAEAAPIEVWVEAIKQARRSDHKRHRTGCVLFDKTGLLAKGCSHTHNGGLKVRSIHAEIDAISKLHAEYLCTAVVVTLTKVDNFAIASKPCRDCAIALNRVVKKVIFAERSNDGSWQVLRMHPLQFDLYDLKATKYQETSLV